MARKYRGHKEAKRPKKDKAKKGSKKASDRTRNGTANQIYRSAAASESDTMMK